MAVATVAIGDVLSATTMTNLKAAVKAEMQRRCYTGSVAAYGGTSYDYATAAGAGVKAVIDFYNKNATPENAVDATTSTITAGTKMTAANINTLINNINTFASRQLSANSLAATSCAAQCTGLCYGSCGTLCSSGCQGNCGAECTPGCVGNCGNGCGNGCGGSCGVNCGGACQADCTGTCMYYCNVCSNGCGNGCGYNCGSQCGGCSGGCGDNCSASCD